MGPIDCVPWHGQGFQRQCLTLEPYGVHPTANPVLRFPVLEAERFKEFTECVNDIMRESRDIVARGRKSAFLNFGLTDPLPVGHYIFIGPLLGPLPMAPERPPPAHL